MADTVLFQTDDGLSESNLARALTRSNSGNYVESGLGLTADFTNNELDVGAGMVIIQDGVDSYVVLPDARSNLALTDAATNYVFVDIDPTVDDTISYHIDTDNTAPSSTSLLIGEVDTTSDTVTELNRVPSVDAGPVSAGVDDSTPAAQSGAIRLPNGEWVAARNNADGGDVDLVRLNASDLLELGAALAGVELGDGHSISVSEDGGAERLADMSVTGTPAAGTEESYSLAVDATDLLKLYAEADGAGGIQNAALRVLADVYDSANALTVYDVATAALAAGSGGVKTGGDVYDSANAKTIYNSTTGKVEEGALPLTEGGPARSDETEVSTTSTTYAVQKTWNAVINATELNAPEKAVLHSETRGDGSGNTVYAALFIDGTKYIEATTTSGTYALLKGGADISGLTEGIHTFELQLKVSAGTGYNRLTEVWFK